MACVTSRTMVGCGRSILSKLPGMWEWGSDVLKVTVCKKLLWTRLARLVLVELAHMARFPVSYRYRQIWLSQANFGPWEHGKL